MVLSTLEARWFFTGPVPDEIIRRFWSAGSWSPPRGLDRAWPEEVRRDDYLVFAPDMGLKARKEPGGATRMEFKGLLTRHGPLELGPRVVGVAEHWVKWSYEGGRTPDSLGEVITGSPESVTVLKRRVLRTVRLDRFGEDEEVAPGVIVDRALQIELTRVLLPDRAPRRHWTLGLEAFPVDPNLAEDVRRNVGPFLTELAAADAVELAAATSRSYPEWLVDVVG